MKNLNFQVVPFIVTVDNLNLKIGQLTTLSSKEGRKYTASTRKKKTITANRLTTEITTTSVVHERKKNKAKRKLTGCWAEIAFCASKFSKPLLHKLGETHT